MRAFVTTTVLTLCLLAGCSARVKEAAPLPKGFNVSPVQLLPGDTVELKFRDAPELNETQTIRRDGKLSLQLVGEVSAAGIAPGELTSNLKTAYSTHLKNPELVVILRRSELNKVYVSGEVLRPGQVEMPGILSVQEAIMAAGGFNMTTAELSSVIVMRPNMETGKYEGFYVDMSKAMKGGGIEAASLQPRDIIYVPRTGIVNLNTFVSQYVEEIVPQTGFLFTVQRGNTTVGYDNSNR